ncbi:MAG: hypothetical protein KBA67_02690 [Leptotrichiaceae bacterium]|nr:hypothetical protein [Leptotrichiaceae bacterium]MBP7100418.1 hypothetical protein [Leptotrichiaceae bacterium]MBP7739399.1 hypothetical protein [Leptotrichiaceae bacterium]MBP9629243.1 hypothetical protein [Leptotrichiaceae bacterium]
MKKLLLFLLVLNTISFSMFNKIKSEIKLKNEEEPRFKEIKVVINGESKMRKVIPGRYRIKMFELNYPTGIIGKNNFYNNFNEVLEKVDKNKKYSVLIEKEFYEDMKKLKTDELSEEEKILELPASSLEGNQIHELLSLTSKLNLKQYLGTDQEYLNRQIYLLYELLNKKEYDINNVYSELDKEFLISELKEKRKKVIKNFEESKFEYFIKNSYSNMEINKYEDDTIYKFDKDIVISQNIEEQAIFPEIKLNVYLTDFPRETLEELAKNRLKLKRNLLLIENSDYRGYTYNENNTILFINGENPLYYFENYKIDVVKERIDVQNLLKESSNYYVSDFFY